MNERSSAVSAKSIVAVIDRIPECQGECILPKPPELPGKGSLVPVGEASRRELAGSAAIRVEYRRNEDHAASEFYIGWLFPELGLIVSSWVPKNDQDSFDRFVAELMATSERGPVGPREGQPQ